MKKYISDFLIKENITLSETYGLLKLSLKDGKLPDIKAGQFVQVEIKESKDTFLRRPISICNVDSANNQLWLLVRKAGKGTEYLLKLKKESSINLIYPLGNGFSFPKEKKSKILLIGGGVGVAPLLFLGKTLQENGFVPEFLIGAKSKADLLLVNEFDKIGKVYVSTDDGSCGEKGFVAQNSILSSCKYEYISCCGPLPMMKSIAGIANVKNIYCEVSLENTMACGIGACLCCVEDTLEKGNVCVCKDGPIFNIKNLKW